MLLNNLVELRLGFPQGSPTTTPQGQVDHKKQLPMTFVLGLGEVEYRIKDLLKVEIGDAIEGVEYENPHITESRVVGFHEQVCSVSTDPSSAASITGVVSSIAVNDALLSIDPDIFPVPLFQDTLLEEQGASFIGLVPAEFHPVPC